MIVRISTEAQYEISDEDAPALDELDTAAVSACEVSNEAQFHQAFDQLLEFVRTKGTPVGGDQLVGSDLILPPPDVSLEEARSEFQGEGLIPS
jgi:hypothetical protein